MKKISMPYEEYLKELEQIREECEGKIECEFQRGFDNGVWSSISSLEEFQRGELSRDRIMDELWISGWPKEKMECLDKLLNHLSNRK